MRIGGLASGIDTDSLIKEMMAAQKLPMDKITQEKTWTEWQKESYRETNLALTSLRTLASDLRLQSSFNSYVAKSSNEAVAGVRTTASAVNGSYQVVVESIAAGAKMHSAGKITTASGTAAKSTDTIGVTGKMTFKAGDAEISIDVTADMTFAQVAKKMQDETAGQKPELRVSFDNTASRFFMSTKGMGAEENFELSFDDQDLAAKVMGSTTETIFSTTGGGANVTAATDGKVSFDGIVIDGLKKNETTINGLTITLGTVGTSTVTVGSDPSATVSKIKDFVEKYNETIKEIEKQLVERRFPDFHPLSDDQKRDMSDREVEMWEEKAMSGLMRNDPILKDAIQELRGSFMNKVEGIPEGNFNLLSQIGISTGSWTEGGKLFIDEDKLTKAVADRPDEVMALFTNRVDDTNVGIGGRIYDTLNNTIKSLGDKAGSPTSLVDNSQLSKRIKQMDTEISKWQDRLARIEDRYWKQFTAMEKAISQMNQQSMFMQQNLFGGM